MKAGACSPLFPLSPPFRGPNWRRFRAAAGALELLRKATANLALDLKCSCDNDTGNLTEFASAAVRERYDRTAPMAIASPLTGLFKTSTQSGGALWSFELCHLMQINQS